MMFGMREDGVQPRPRDTGGFPDVGVSADGGVDAPLRRTERTRRVES